MNTKGSRRRGQGNLPQRTPFGPMIMVILFSELLQLVQFIDLYKGCAGPTSASRSSTYYVEAIQNLQEKDVLAEECTDPVITGLHFVK
jgi:hypothetical protein